MVVLAAIASNVAVATSKFVVAGISGSSAMLSEAVHSSADTANQLLLLFGEARARKPADERHPFGYDGEVYFWAFVVAMLVLFVGGLGSMLQGVLELRRQEPMRSPALSLVVLGLSAVFEGSALAFSYRSFKRVVARHPGDGRPVSMWTFIKRSKDPGLYESLLEDSTALLGVAIAAVGVVGTGYLGIPWMDPVASVAIGLLLIANAVVIAQATRGLITGESAVSAVRQDLVAALRRDGFEREFLPGDVAPRPRHDPRRAGRLGDRTASRRTDRRSPCGDGP